MKKSLLIKSSGLYCINFEIINKAQIHQSGNANRILLFSKAYKDPMFILYYKEPNHMKIAYRNIQSIIDSKQPGKVIKVDFRKD